MAAETDVLAKKWGDSIAVILPREIVAKEKIRPLDRVHLIVHKEDTLSNFFGRFKTKKTPQELKNESRNSWH